MKGHIGGSVGEAGCFEQHEKGVRVEYDEIYEESAQGEKSKPRRDRPVSGTGYWKAVMACPDSRTVSPAPWRPEFPGHKKVSRVPEAGVLRKGITGRNPIGAFMT